MKGLRCSEPGEHYPETLGADIHHILPVAYGGPNTDANTIALCETTHSNVHAILRLLLKRPELPTYGRFKADHFPDVRLSRFAFALACEGWRRIHHEETP